MRRLGIGLVGLLIGLSTTGIALTAASRPAASGDPAHGLIGFRDVERGSYMQVTLSGEEAGDFSFGVAGVGLFVPSGPATLTSQGHDHVKLQWSGAGLLDRGAEFDPTFGSATPTGELEDVKFSIRAELHPERRAANAHVKWEKQNLLLNTRDAPQTADALLQLTIAALEGGDWGAVWDLATDRLRQSVPREDFASSAAVEFAKRGEVASVSAGALEYRVAQDGLHYATAEIVLTMDSAGMLTEYVLDAVVVLDGQEWRWLSLNPRAG